MPLFSQTKTAQNIMDASSQDIRQVLSSAATPDSNVLLDYVNRVHLFMLRFSKWEWELSAPQRFMTQLGVTDYWIGPTGGGPLSAFDTGLNLLDIRTIAQETVFDRTNFRILGQTDTEPLIAKLAYPDTSSRLGRPAEYRQAVDTPNILNLYPAPDNQGTYTPVPEPPICTAVSGGTLANRVYWVTCTFVDTLGNESSAPFPTKIFLPAGTLLSVNPPLDVLWNSLPKGATTIQYDRFNVYAGSSAYNVPLLASNLLLQSSHNPNNAAWIEPASGLITSGPNPPVNNLVEPIDGYVIEFRYNKQRPQLNAGGSILAIPDDYFDVMVAGVNYVTFHYCHEPAQAEIWKGIFGEGLTSIIRDRNWFMTPGNTDFIRADASTIGGRLPAVESLDLSVLIS